MNLKISALFTASMLLCVQAAFSQAIEMKKQDFVYPVNIPIEKPKVVASPSDLVSATGVPTINPSQVNINTALIASEWRITHGDSTVSTAIQRWASQAGYQVAWQAEKDLPAYVASYQGSFENAVEALMSDTKHSAYPLHACLYDNKVIRVLHLTQTCGQ